MTRVTKRTLAALAAGKLPEPTEREFQQQVLEFAQLYGWKRAHFRPARVMRGGKETWETPVAADGKGFPDLILVHRVRGILIVAELKRSENEEPTTEQKDWLRAFEGVPGIVVRLWSPADWPSIETLLKG